MTNTVLMRLDADGSSVLASPVTETDTSIPLSDAQWTADVTQFPLMIAVGGEIVSAGAISTAGTQTFTSCTRSVNGVVKAHIAGVEVRAAEPFLLGLGAHQLATAVIFPDTENPVVTPGQNFAALEESINGTLIGTVLATDNVAVTGFAITAGNTGSAFTINNAGQITVATSAAVIAGAFALTVEAQDSVGNTGSALVIVLVSEFAYAWEQRPAYVEVDPTALAGSPGKLLADLYGITSRATVANLTQWNLAVAAVVPGRQIYVTANIVGNGISQTCNYLSTDAVQGAGSAQHGTEANPVMITTAPGVVISGGQTPGGQDLNSRALQIRGAPHVWLYGAHFTDATFVAKFDQCNSSAVAPARIWHCTFTNAGHNLVHLSGYFGAHPTTGEYGQSSFFDVRYNEFAHAGLGSNQFGEGFYTGVGTADAFDDSACHDITVEANLFRNLPAEAVDAKSGGYNHRINFNLIRDCGDSLTRIGAAANEGLPGGIQLYPPGQFGLAPGWTNDSEVIGNRFIRISSAAAKFPDGQILVCARGTAVIGNYFEDCTIPSIPLINIYLQVNATSTTGAMTFGDAGSLPVHNNTSKVAKVLHRISIVGGTNPTELAAAQSALTASNNVGTSSQTGVDLVVTLAAFGNDGTGFEGATAVPAVAGALDVVGADTTGLWTIDFGGAPVVAPVNPGARQLV